MSIQRLTDDTFEQVLNHAEGPVLVDFSAAWCPPCRLQRPLLESFAEAHPEVQIAELDVDLAPQVAARLRIQSLPTLVLFRQGEPVARARGLQTASKLEALVAAGD